MSKHPIDIDNLTDAAAEAQTQRVLLDLATATTQLQRALTVAREVQWQAPLPIFGAVSGEPNRPTENTAMDPKRLLLRARVISGERLLAEVTAALQTAASELSEALSAYYDE